MVSKEALRTVAYECERRARPYGLVHAQDTERFRLAYVDECELRTLDTDFDELCIKTGEGFAECGNDTIRVDVRHEVGTTWVRSISTLQGIENGIQYWHCNSRIDNYEEDVHLLAVHDYTVDSEGFVQEPEVGSPQIAPGSHADFMMHFRVLEDARPIAELLSQSA